MLLIWKESGALTVLVGAVVVIIVFLVMLIERRIKLGHNKPIKDGYISFRVKLTIYTITLMGIISLFSDVFDKDNMSSLMGHSLALSYYRLIMFIVVLFVAMVWIGEKIRNRK